MPDYYLFALSLVMILTLPGPNMILLFQTGSVAGRLPGLITVTGLGLTRLCHIFFAAVGLGTLFRLTPWTFDVVKYAGAAYLLWLGIKILRSDTFATAPEADGRRVTGILWTFFGNGFLTNLLNPKALLFSSVLLPQFIDPSMGSVAVQFAVLGIILVLVGMLFDSTYALAGKK